MPQRKLRWEREFENILSFLKSCGGCYAEIQPYVEEHVIVGMAAQQYLFVPDKCFVTWWMLNEERLQMFKDHIRPDDISSGHILTVIECGCKDRASMLEIRRKLRRLCKQGVYWHRSGKGWQEFPGQKGGRYGKQ